MEEIGVDQPLLSAGYVLLSISCEMTAAVWAFVVDPPYHSVSVVAETLGRVAYPYACYLSLVSQWCCCVENEDGGRSKGGPPG